jgi:hypothetical protein
MFTYQNFTADEIIAAFAANPNALEVDVESVRFNAANTCAYFKALLNVNGTKYVPSLKFFNQKTVYRIMAPEDRAYEGTSLSFGRDQTNDDGSESNFGKACDLIFTAFTKKVKELVASKLLSDDMDDDENTAATKVVPSVKAGTPIRKVRVVEGVREQLDNPIITVPIAQKYYSKEEESNLELLPGKMFKRKTFDVKFMDLTCVENGRPTTSLVDGEHVDSSNIHEYITRGSEISGVLSFDIISSKQGLNLKLKPYRMVYVRPALKQQSADIFKDDDFAMMGLGAPAAAPPKALKEEHGGNHGVAEGDDEDPNMAAINNLTL